MGHAPARPFRPTTRVEAERYLYVHDVIDLDEFERRVAAMLADGTADDVWRPSPPPSPFRAPEMQSVWR